MLLVSGWFYLVDSIFSIVVLLMFGIILVWFMLCYSIRCRWLVMFFLFRCMWLSRVCGLRLVGIVIGRLRCFSSVCRCVWLVLLVRFRLVDSFVVSIMFIVIVLLWFSVLWFGVE